MPRVTIEFDACEEAAALQHAINAVKYAATLASIDEYCRRVAKDTEDQSRKRLADIIRQMIGGIHIVDEPP